VTISDEEIREALDECINIIINSIRVVLERTPPSYLPISPTWNRSGRRRAP
jgi:actin-like ATPase involved in cell morphogenesis